MGNVFHRKRVVTEELENLSAQMRSFRSDIEYTFQRRKNILWYTTLTVFFATTSLAAYIFMVVPKRELNLFFFITTLFGGILALYVFRRVINVYYDYIVDRKRKYLDSIIEKKNQILENVKETETFKVASEILEKYGDENKQELLNPSPQTNSPSMARKSPSASALPAPQTSSGNGPQRGMGIGSIGPGPRPATSLGNISQLPPNNLRRFGQPPRPHIRESKNSMDKVVDYFFGDGPNNRYALICTSCNGHNGMAFPGEYEYLAFYCYLCGQFNPAKKLRPTLNRQSMAAGEVSLPPKPHSTKEENTAPIIATGVRPHSSQEGSIISEKSENVTDDDFEEVGEEGTVA